MEKRLFQILDELNVLDDDGVGRALISGTVVRADWSQKGTVFQMGLGGGMNNLLDVETGKKFPLLVLVDKAEYDRIKNQVP